MQGSGCAYVFGSIVLVVAAVAGWGCKDRTRPPESAAACGEAAALAVGSGPAEWAAGEEYRAFARHETAARVGTPTDVVVAAFPCGRWKINLEYPAKLKVAAAEGFAVSSETLRLEDAVRREQAGLRFELAFTPRVAGEGVVELKLRFGLCDEARCVTRETTFAWAYAVEE